MAKFWVCENHGGVRMSITLWQYYQNLAETIGRNAFIGCGSAADWQNARPELMHQFRMSVGLEPWPKYQSAAIRDYGEFSGNGYRVRKIAYTILPDCWATANVYFPDPLPERKSPAVLYVSGHDYVGVEAYRDHAAMWAKRGYVCLVFDTIEQHDNPGEHHGLYYRHRYDWISMGYSAIGGELWNSVRALDILAGLPEVDTSRIGVTGISGGGALSLFLGMVDDRVRAIAASCGMSVYQHTLSSRHLLNHCDCFYPHNLFRRDAGEFAGLIAPKPLLFCFATHDFLFSEDEYRTLYERTRKVYRWLGHEEECALFKYPGPHGYQPESIAAINAWFDLHVAGEPRSTLGLEEKEHDEPTVSVFNGDPPAPNHLDLLPGLLSHKGAIPLPERPEQWPSIVATMRQRLRADVFPFLEKDNETFTVECLGNWISEGHSCRKFRGEIAGIEVWIQIFAPLSGTDRVLVGIANADENAEDVSRHLAGSAPDAVRIAVEPRGTGFTACQTQFWSLLRAGALTGMTPTQMAVHDLRHILKWLLVQPETENRKIVLHGRKDAGIAVLYHAIFDDAVSGIIAEDCVATHRHGGYIPGILRVLDIEHAAGLIAPRFMAFVNPAPIRKMWATRAYQRLGHSDRLVVTHSLGHAWDRFSILRP
jgi:dienelactone hydrolase